jgi:hypothetical protein
VCVRASVRAYVHLFMHAYLCAACISECISECISARVRANIFLGGTNPISRGDGGWPKHGGLAKAGLGVQHI